MLLQLWRHSIRNEVLKYVAGSAMSDSNEWGGKEKIKTGRAVASSRIRTE